MSGCLERLAGSKPLRSICSPRRASVSPGSPPAPRSALAHARSPIDASSVLVGIDHLLGVLVDGIALGVLLEALAVRPPLFGGPVRGARGHTPDRMTDSPPFAGWTNCLAAATSSSERSARCAVPAATFPSTRRPRQPRAPFSWTSRGPARPPHQRPRRGALGSARRLRRGGGGGACRVAPGDRGRTGLEIEPSRSSAPTRTGTATRGSTR